MNVLTLFAATAIAQTTVLGTMPVYPGATRPLPQWENPKRAIAMTTDKPEAVLTYYLSTAPRGWAATKDSIAEARASILSNQPAWLTFRRPGWGRLDMQFTTGHHPKLGHPITLIFYESHFKH